MPTKTFSNLPQEKRERIARAAKKEFSESPFADASINRIIKAAGISRGSFYMYFVDKYDLVFFLLEDFKSQFKLAVSEIGEAAKGDMAKMMVDFHDLFFDAMTNSENRNFISNFLIFSFSATAREKAHLCISEGPFTELKHHVIKYIDVGAIAEQFRNDLEIVVDTLFIIMKNVLGLSFVTRLDKEESRSIYIKQLQLVRDGYQGKEEAKC